MTFHVIMMQLKHKIFLLHKRIVDKALLWLLLIQIMVKKLEVVDRFY